MNDGNESVVSKIGIDGAGSSNRGGGRGGIGDVGSCIGNDTCIDSGVEIEVVETTGVGADVVVVTGAELILTCSLSLAALCSAIN